MQIKDILKRTLNARNVAKGLVQAANDSYTVNMDSLQRRLEKREITDGFYYTERARLKEEREQARAAAVKPLEDIREEFHRAVDDWAQPAGDKLDMNTVWIIQNMDLTAAEFNRLLEENKYNPTMYRAIRSAAEKKRDEMTEANKGKPINQQVSFDLADPIQNPEARKAEFDSFLLGIESSLSDYYVTAVDSQNPSGASYKSIQDKLSATAARYAERIQPMEAGDDTSPADFPFEVTEPQGVPKVW